MTADMEASVTTVLTNLKGCLHKDSNRNMVTVSAALVVITAGKLPSFGYCDMNKLLITLRYSDNDN